MSLTRNIRNLRKETDGFEFTKVNKKRPFWQRALMWGGGAVLFLGISITASVFIMKNMLGYEKPQSQQEVVPPPIEPKVKTTVVKDTLEKIVEEEKEPELIKPTFEVLRAPAGTEDLITDPFGNFYILTKTNAGTKLEQYKGSTFCKYASIRKIMNLEKGEIFGGFDFKGIGYYYRISNIEDIPYETGSFNLNISNFEMTNPSYVKKISKKITYNNGKDRSEDYTLPKSYPNSYEALSAPKLVDGKVSPKGNNYILIQLDRKKRLATKWGRESGSITEEYFASFLLFDKLGNLIKTNYENKEKHFLSSEYPDFSNARISTWDGKRVNVLKLSTLGIFIYDEFWELQEGFGKFGNSIGQFIRPQDIAISPNNKIYVVDTGNNRIQKFSSTGNFLKSLGEYGANPGQFDNPTRIVVDQNQNIYVYDKGNNRIQKISNW